MANVGPMADISWRRGRRRMTAPAMALVAVAALTTTMVLSGCGSDISRAPTDECQATASCAVATPTTTTTAEPVDLAFRPVLSFVPEDPAAGVSACPTDPNPVGPTDSGTMSACADGVITATYQVGPVALDGSAVASATAVVNLGRWEVNPVLRDGPEGIDVFNAVAAHCAAADDTCPTGQLAIVVDGLVVSAPVIQQASFAADQIVISGNFDQAGAEALAAALTPPR